MAKAGAGGPKRTLLIALCCVLVVALAALLVITIVTNHLLGQIQRPEDTTLSSSEIQEIINANTDPGTTTQETELEATTEPTQTTSPTEVTESSERIHILLIGQDASSVTSWQKSEVMILCTVNKKAKTLTMTSFLRDMYVQIPGYGSNKLHMAYAIGGMKLLDQTLEENFGVKVDANIAVNFSGFIQLVDMAGGVKIDLTAAEANYLNTHGNWGITSANGWNLKAGKTILTGAQAAGYARIQKLDNELGRTDRQRKVLAALVQQAKALSIAELYDLVEAGCGMIATDMTNSEILSYVAELAPLLGELKTVTQRIPVEGSYSYETVGSISNCAVIDLDANRKFLEETLKP